MLERLLRINIYSLDWRVALAMGFALLAATIFTDYITTYELSLTPFYLFIVLLVTWNCGWKLGLLFAFISFVAPLVIGQWVGNPYSEQIYFYIDNANRLISYLVALALTAQLKKQHERERSSARLDYLTGIANLKGFHEALGIELARHRRKKEPMSVAYVDCDNFKEVNDRSGHREGDRLLLQVANVLTGNLRKTDVVGRLGGDEFAVILSNTDEIRASNVIDKLRGELNTSMAEHRWQVTFSIGLGIFPGAPVSADDVISFADKLMYRVKASGKNKVMTETFAPLELMKGL